MGFLLILYIYVYFIKKSVIEYLCNIILKFILIFIQIPVYWVLEGTGGYKLQHFFWWFLPTIENLFQFKQKALKRRKQRDFCIIFLFNVDEYKIKMFYSICLILLSIMTLFYKFKISPSSLAKSDKYLCISEVHFCTLRLLISRLKKGCPKVFYYICFSFVFW